MALIPAKAARCSGRSSFAVPRFPVDDLRVESTEDAYRGMLGWVDGGKKAAYSGAMPLIFWGQTFRTISQRWVNGLAIRFR
jgi:hypothetical protein